MRGLLVLGGIILLLYCLPYFVAPKVEQEVSFNSSHDTFNEQIEIVVGSFTFWDTMSICNIDKSVPFELTSPSCIHICVQRKVRYSYPIVEGPGKIEIISSINPDSTKIDTVQGYTRFLFTSRPVEIPAYSEENLNLFHRYQTEIASQEPLKREAQRAIEKYVIQVIKTETHGTNPDSDSGDSNKSPPGNF